MPYRPLKRILLVDDDPDLLAVVSLALTALGGYTVETCSTAHDALESARSFAPDLILLDIMMPGMDGFGIQQALREIEVTARTPVVFLSAKVLRGEVAQSEALGCLGIISKPFDPGTLTERLEELWGIHVRRQVEAHQKEFEALRRAYLGELSEKIGAMQAAASVLAINGWDRSIVESLYQNVHRMAGSSGLYRLAGLSRTAGALEEIIKRLLSSPTWPPASSPGELATLVQAVGRTARTEARLAPSSTTPPAHPDQVSGA